ncbi:DUF1194 domain-containing protein [Hoeflea prorocentri]|uniref:DUF1194 domain-containing protein n=1 Tax=Hoeflea prorocentri TaxID=1922333 RepID=A0A9X3UF88_9HYPH|nr:DUF1194 domain-containing protein [Hoeflea prorocentri]MCY6379460.1 DUF1194 domain-containing protein [Hoeflea prorocentri]MDA5397260.1 DUF1194 domain-containing protein [Hoeflea prorocentri]
MTPNARALNARAADPVPGLQWCLNGLLAAVLCALTAIGPVSAVSATEVDVELVIAVDVSRSMTERELRIQRRGYAEALRSPAVARAVQNTLTGKIALTYVEWGGIAWQRVVVDWHILENAADLAAFAEKITLTVDTGMRRTSISGAIADAAARIENNDIQSLRRVIDISGDGPNNSGPPVTGARDTAVARGITINGLPLMTREGLGTQFHLEDLDEYYHHCVIGGPGSFVIPVTSWDEFPEAVRRKLVLELAAMPQPLKAAFSGKTDTGYDCLIGEKIWQHFIDQYPYELNP